jgi:hypothetical protein
LFPAWHFKIDDIAVEVQRLYNAIHPDEGMGDVTFAFDPAKKASLELYMGYAGATVPPQAYFSQSHLDTLGLCITMALAMRERPEETILVLDDVLGSVDAPHVARVFEMIVRMSQNFRHVIVTTHDAAFQDAGRWRGVFADRVQFTALSPWAMGEGMQAREVF